MKTLITFVIGAVFALPAVAGAASFIVAPANGSYKAGDTVSLNVSVNPSGSTIYTALLDARFTVETFEVVSFTLNDNLLPLKASGYDALDNTKGVLTKTGGYTGGITSTAPFGTIVLRAKKAGSATFTVSDTSKLLDGNNANKQSGTQTMTYSISAVQSAPQTVPAPIQSITPTTQTDTVTKTTDEQEVNFSDDNPINETADVNTQIASVAATTVPLSMNLVLALLLSLAAFLAGFLLGRKTAFVEQHITRK